MQDVAAFILAGGKSTRMGEDKAFLKLQNQTLLERALELARAVCTTIGIIGSATKFSAFAPVIEDIFPGQGPLAGIHAGLKNSHADLNLILAVDLPFMDPRFLQHLISQARASKAIVTVPRCAGGWQPLCAVYRREFASTAENSLREGRNKIDPLFARVPTQVVDDSDLLQLGLSPEIFHNLNTPEDLAQAQ